MSELTLQIARKVDPKRAGLALAVIWAVFALVGIVVSSGHGEWTLQAFDLRDSSLDDRLSMPASFTALLLVVGAGLALALSNVDRTRRQKKWRLAGFALLLFGVEELFGIHSWLETRGVSWALSYLPVLALGSAGLLGALRIFGREPVAQALFGGAIVLWLGAAALDNPELTAAHAAAELLEMAAAGVFALALLERLRYLARAYYPLEEAETRLSLDQIAAEALDRVKLRPILNVLLLLTAVFAIQHVFLQRGDYHGNELRILDINAEQTLWATIQGALVLAAGGLAIVTGRLRVTAASTRSWWLLLGAVLIVLGADEIIAVHDRFQDATGYPGQEILIPVAFVGIVAWLKVLGATWDNRRTRDLLIAGAALWLFSQAIDVIVQDYYRWTIVPEEVAETLGTTLWLAAVLHWLRSVLPVGLIPPEPSAGQLNGHAIIEPLRERGPREQAPTG